MYRFQIRAQTKMGESIVLTGSTPELGSWDLTQCVHLQTSADRYPLWWTDVPIDFHLGPMDARHIEYQYVRMSFQCDPQHDPQWESPGINRWIPIDPNHSDTIVVEDTHFGQVQPYPFGYFENPLPKPSLTLDGLKIVIIGSSVALGYNDWLMDGWAEQLSQQLHKTAGHQVINVSQLGTNVSSTLDRFDRVVAPHQPHIVIIALSLGNEGFAYCAAHDRRALQRRFESGLQHLVKKVWELGALPILGGVYPHGDYTPDHNWLLYDTHHRMMTWGVPILNWLEVLNDGQGRWRSQLAFDPAHPNTLGHQQMFQAIDLNLFKISKVEIATDIHRFTQQIETPIYQDQNGFCLSAKIEDKQLRMINRSRHSYTIAPYWQELQTSLQSAKLIPGLYLSNHGHPAAILNSKSDGSESRS